jgi:hypothetical protein
MEMLKEKHDYIINYLIKKNYNDGDLGREIRKIFFGDPVVLRFSSDLELGREIRKIYQNLEK